LHGIPQQKPSQSTRSRRTPWRTSRELSPVACRQLRRCLMPRLTPFRLRFALIVAVLAGPGLVLLHGQDKKAAPKAQLAWTLDEALAQLELHPRDPYLQYVALQLARRAQDVEGKAKRLEGLILPDQLLEQRGPNRTGQVDLFSMFTG